jgi:hypothetical protein
MVAEEIVEGLQEVLTERIGWVELPLRLGAHEGVLCGKFQSYKTHGAGGDAPQPTGGEL